MDETRLNRFAARQLERRQAGERPSDRPTETVTARLEAAITKRGQGRRSTSLDPARILKRLETERRLERAGRKRRGEPTE